MTELDEILKKQILPAAFEFIERRTIPVFYFDEREDEVKRDRTGVLYAVGGRHFILTASHSLQAIAGDNRTPSFVFESDGITPIPFSNLKILGTEVDGRDIAAIVLDDDTASDLKRSKLFLNHSEILPRDSGPSSLYALYGYPGAWTHQSPNRFVAPGFGLLTSRHAGARGEGFYDPRVNIVIGMKDRPIRTDTGVAEKLENKMRGISGGGIWRLLEKRDAHSIRSWRPENISLCAIQHRWHEGRDYAQGTWAAFALDRIQDEFPDVRKAMGIDYGK